MRAISWIGPIFHDSHTSHNESCADENSAGLDLWSMQLLRSLMKICYNARISLMIENRGIYFFRPARTAQNASQNAFSGDGPGRKRQSLAALVTPRRYRRGWFLYRCRWRCFPRPWRIQVKLSHLIEQGFVTDPQHLRGIFAAPARLFQRVGDGFHLGLVFQAAHQRLQPLLLGRRGLLPRRSPLTRRGHLDQFAQAALIVFENDIPFDEVLQLSQVARPWIIHRCIQKILGRSRWALAEFLAVLLQEMTEKKWYLRCPLPKRWHVDGQNVQSVIEIFAEAPCLHRFLNINVCCGQHAHVGLDQVPPAQT